MLKSGRLHRYNIEASKVSIASRFEVEYADFQDTKYCLVCASGGYAISIALRAAGVKPDDEVLTNAFTLAPVPGAIAAVGAKSVLVEINDDLVIDLADLESKIVQSGARFFLLSNMRGHMGDMDAIAALTKKHGVIMIEDCAHTMGASWNGQKSGNFGLAGCFSTQTYKHINSGEGGIITSNDEEFMARAIILSGSYMLFDRHLAAPSKAVFDKVRLETPNMSGRMDNLRAAILSPQLQLLDQNIVRWNARYNIVAEILSLVSGIKLPKRDKSEHFVGSSIQFSIPDIGAEKAHEFITANSALGVELKWFGEDEPKAFTSNHHSWHYVEKQNLPQTDKILSSLFDLRLPLTFSLQDCAHLSAIIVHCFKETFPGFKETVPGFKSVLPDGDKI